MHYFFQSPNVNPFLDFAAQLANPDYICHFFMARLARNADFSVIEGLRFGTLAHYITDVRVGNDYLVAGFTVSMRGAFADSFVRHLKQKCGIVKDSDPAMIMVEEVHNGNLRSVLLWLAWLVRFRLVFANPSRWVTEEDLLNVHATAVIHAFASGYSEHGLDYCKWIGNWAPQYLDHVVPVDRVASHPNSLLKSGNVMYFVVNAEVIPTFSVFDPMEKAFGPMDFLGILPLGHDTFLLAFVSFVAFTDYLQMESFLIGLLINYRGESYLLYFFVLFFSND
jgi:hypothetical protein